MRRLDSSRDGDQFTLDLFREVPWEGRSPRALTRGNKLLYLRQEPPKPRGEVLLCEQLELWPVEGHTEREAPSPTGKGSFSSVGVEV